MTQITSKEFNEILQIEKASYKYFFNSSQLKKALTEFKLLKIIRKNKVIAYLLYKIEKDKIYVRRIAVSPNYRRKGYGTQIMLEIFKIAQKLNLKKIYLYVRISNKKGIKFYQKLNFLKIRKIKKHYPDGEDAYLMEKEI